MLKERQLKKYRSLETSLETEQNNKLFIVEDRLANVLESMRLLGSCGNKSYGLTDDQMRRISFIIAEAWCLMDARLRSE